MPFRPAPVLLAFAVALAAAPGAALAQARAGDLRAAFLLGMEDGDGDAGLQLRGDLELAPTALSPAVSVSPVVSVGWSRFHEEETDFFFDEEFEATANILRVMPAARFAFGRHARLRPYADAGLGLYFASWSFRTTDLFTGQTFESDDSEAGLVLRFAFGASLLVSDGLALGAELGFMPYLGDAADDTTMSALVSATFRL